MSSKWKADNFKVYYYFVLLALLFVPFGCAMLQEPSPVEIFASRLSCEKNPTIVDGDLTTVGSFETDGVIRKGFRGRQYKRQVAGNPKTEMLIKLDAPTYVAYVEIYPASTIRRFALDTAGKRSLKGQLAFTPVEDKRGKTVKGTQPVRFQIGRKIRYLRLTAYALEAPENVVHNEDVARELNVLSEIPEVLQQKWEKEKREGRMHIPLKGAAIREVKFYGRK